MKDKRLDAALVRIAELEAQSAKNWANVIALAANLGTISGSLIALAHHMEAAEKQQDTLRADIAESQQRLREFIERNDKGWK